jgi:hypothetical protein
VIAGGAGGAILTAIIGAIKNKAAAYGQLDDVPFEDKLTSHGLAFTGRRQPCPTGRQPDRNQSFQW